MQPKRKGSESEIRSDATYLVVCTRLKVPLKTKGQTHFARTKLETYPCMQSGRICWGFGFYTCATRYSFDYEAGCVFIRGGWAGSDHTRGPFLKPEVVTGSAPYASRFFQPHELLSNSRSIFQIHDFFLNCMIFFKFITFCKIHELFSNS